MVEGSFGDPVSAANRNSDVVSAEISLVGKGSGHADPGVGFVCVVQHSSPSQRYFALQ